MKKSAKRAARLLRRPLFWLAIGVGLFHFITMPGFFYAGDNYAVRGEASHLLMTGEWGIPFGDKSKWAGFFDQRGQYFVENDGKQRFFSKYGVGYTLLCLPPLLAERLYAGSVHVLNGSRSLLFATNIYQIILSLIALVYLYLIVSLYTQRTWQRVFFVLSSFYCTFVWHYLRAPTLEIFQIFPFLGFCYHFLLFIRSRNGGERPAWAHLFLGTCWLSLLFFTKVTHGLTFGIAWLFAGFAGPSRLPLLARLRTNLVEHWKSYVWCLALPTLLTAALFLGTNHYRTGSIFEDGYRQWITEEGEAKASLHISAIPNALKGLFWTLNEYNVWVNYPVFVFAVFGMRRFFRANRLDSWFIGAVFLSSLSVIACLKWWEGSWCYAPRYTILILLVGGLPFVETLEILRGCVRPKVAKADGKGKDSLDADASFRLSFGVVGSLVILFVLLYSLYLQVCVNSLQYFTHQYITGYLSPLKQERLDRYWASARHRGYVHRDLIRYGWMGDDYYPIKVIESIAPPGPNGEAMVRDIRRYVDSLTVPNYFFLRTDRNGRK